MGSLGQGNGLASENPLSQLRMRGQDLTGQDTLGASYPLSVPVVGAGKGQGPSLNSASFTTKPLASSVYVHVPETPSLLKRSILVTSLFPHEDLFEGLFGGMGLLIEELPADLVLPGQLGDRFSPGEHLGGQVLPLLGQQSLGGTRNIDICRRWPDSAGDRREIALRDREVRSSLTIHVCFLRETVFVGTNNPNMEETGSIENPIPPGKCYLELNRADSGT